MDACAVCRRQELEAEIERLRAEHRKLILALVRIDYEAKCDWCAKIAADALPDVMPAYVKPERKVGGCAKPGGGG